MMRQANSKTVYVLVGRGVSTSDGTVESSSRVFAKISQPAQRCGIAIESSSKSENEMKPTNKTRSPAPIEPLRQTRRVQP